MRLVWGNFAMAYELRAAAHIVVLEEVANWIPLATIVASLTVRIKSHMSPLQIGCNHDWVL